MRAGVTDKSLSLKSPASPTGIAKQSPCYNVASRKRRRFLNRWIKSLATEAGRIKIKNELRRRIRHNKYWVNEANKYGIETLCELMLAIFDRVEPDRTALIEGIARYGHKQVALAARIEDDRHKMAALEAAATPDFDAIDAQEEQLDWNTRIFQDRQQALSYVCETPVILEQRVFALARAIAAGLK